MQPNYSQITVGNVTLPKAVLSTVKICAVYIYLAGEAGQVTFRKSKEHSKISSMLHTRGKSCIKFHKSVSKKRAPSIFLRFSKKTKLILGKFMHVHTRGDSWVEFHKFVSKKCAPSSFFHSEHHCGLINMKILQGDDTFLKKMLKIKGY